MTPKLDTAATAQPSAASAPASSDSALYAQALEVMAERAREAKQFAVIEAQWCSHAKQAHQQARTSIQQGHAPGASPEGISAMVKAQHELPGHRALFNARWRLMQEWATQMQRDPDARNQATGLMFAVKVSGDRAAQQRLQDLALNGSDPYVLTLWRLVSGPCVFGKTCEPAPRGRWAQIEPANLFAWLPAYGDTADLTPAQWQGILAARYAEHPQYELMKRLLAFAPEAPGLRQEAALRFIDDIPSEFTLAASLRHLAAHCERASGELPRAACLHAAELTWNSRQPSWGERDQARQLVRRLQAHESTPWAERLQAFEPTITLERLSWSVVGDRHTFGEQAGCEILPAWRRHLKAVTEGGSYRLLPGVDGRP